MFYNQSALTHLFTWHPPLVIKIIDLGPVCFSGQKKVLYNAHILCNTARLTSVFVPSLFGQGLRCKMPQFYKSLIKLFKRTGLSCFLFINSFYSGFYGQKQNIGDNFSSSLVCVMVNIKSRSCRRGHFLVHLLQLFFFFGWSGELTLLDGDVSLESFSGDS